MSYNQIISKELEEFKTKYGFIEPDRGNFNDDSTLWRNGKPNYDRINLEYFKGKSMNHKADSLEKLVEDLVKKWEMESEHKLSYSQWETVNHEKYTLNANGGKVYKKDETMKCGNYVALLNVCDKNYFDDQKEDFQSSHQLMKNAFLNGFPWEVVHVFSGPPKVVFSWRHWATFNGKFRDNKGNGELVELYGIGVVTVDENLKIMDIETYFKPNEFFEVLDGKKDSSELNKGQQVVGTGCPYLKSVQK